MKKVLKWIVIFTLAMFLVCFIYDFLTLSMLPESISESITSDIFDNNYSQQITEAQNYLKRILNKTNVPSFSVAVMVQ